MAKKTKKAARKTTAKKSKKVARTTTAKKSKKVARKAAKPAKASRASSAKAVATSGKIASITPTRDGLAWTIRCAKGPAVAVSAGAAQACRVKVGAAWTPALAARVEQAALDQLAFTHAMEALATKGAIRRTELEKLLGGDARAKRTVDALVRNGWVR